MLVILFVPSHAKEDDIERWKRELGVPDSVLSVVRLERISEPYACVKGIICTKNLRSAGGIYSAVYS
jgi:hypothetical protein